MVALPLLLAHASCRTQATEPKLKKVAVTATVSVSIPATAKPDPDNKKQDPTYKLWAYLDGGVEYDVEVMSAIKKLEPGASPDRVAAEFVAGLIEDGDNPMIRRQRDITFNGWLGIEALVSRTYKIAGEFATWSRVYVVNDTLYCVAVSYPTKSGRPTAAEPFLDSISIADAAKQGPFATPGPIFTTFSPKGGGFTVGMPSQPKEDDLQMSKGKYKSVIHSGTAAYGNRMYRANFLALPSDAPDPTQGEKNEGLATLVDQAVKALEGKTVGLAETVTRDGVEFVKVLCVRPDGVMGRIEASFAQRHIYILLMAYPSGHAGSPDIDTFFNSFKLLPK